MSIIKLGILKETKTPPDRRVAITPKECKRIIDKYSHIKIYVQKSEFRCFSDDEYKNIPGVTLVENLDNCNVLIGVKETKVETLLPSKIYFFFSHTTKQQPYNKKLLQSILEKNITLIDYEHLTDRDNVRIIAFSRWAGIIGCYNGLKALGERLNLFKLKPAHILNDREKVHEELDRISLPPIKILITGDGRASNGALEILDYMNIKRVGNEDYLNNKYDEPVYCQLAPENYVERVDGEKFDLQHFIDNPKMYKSTFKPYTTVTDMLATCHYWDPNSPVLFTSDHMKDDNFEITTIADITCDIKGSVPSTLRPSTIKQPVYGYLPHSEEETDPYKIDAVTIMAVDNLPAELPKDASSDFSNTLFNDIIPSLLEADSKNILHKATIAKDGQLTERYSYLKDYVS
ncbi:MAG TPA: NAD(P)-dependent oxidoreductase [Victivallales bacterium]|nr:NAD(P)-dependent oxidoreductase [Victivallales bacterium]